MNDTLIIHITKEFSDIVDIINTSSFRLSYCGEIFNSGNNRISSAAHPMVCFSEYSFPELQGKEITYGKYGVAFTKEWAERKKLNPVIYVEKNSQVAKGLGKLLKARQGRIDNVTLPDQLRLPVMQLKCFTKNVRGYNSCFEDDNFYFKAENEWRYVPTLNESHREERYQEKQSLTFDSSYQQATPLSNDMIGSAENSTWLTWDIASLNRVDGTWLTWDTNLVAENGTWLQWDIASLGRVDGTWLTSDTDINAENGTWIPGKELTILAQDAGAYQHDILHPVILEPLDPYRYGSNPLYANFAQNGYIPDGDYVWDFARHDNIAIKHYLGLITNTMNSSFTVATWLESWSAKSKWLIPQTSTTYPTQGKSPWIDLPLPSVDPTPPSGANYTIPDQEVYRMENTITVTLDNDITVIGLSNITLSLDADSYAWQFSSTLLDPDDKSLVTQNPDGSAKILHITINGYDWHVLVEKIVTNRIYGQQSISLTGRGLTALLSKPYVQPKSVSYDAVQDNSQIVNSMLPVGWTGVWNIPIWSVDAKAYAYQEKTYAEAIIEAVRYMGGVAVPSRDSQTITFIKRYPVLPWNYAATVVEVSISDSAILALTEEPVSSFQANGVYIHGGEVGGELRLVRRNGTAGDKLAPTQSNNLMVDANTGIRALGERILSGQAEQPKIRSFTTFMDGTIIPLIEIGNLIGITVDTVETKAIVNGITVSASVGNNGVIDVTQSITIGENTENTWVAFNDLLPSDPLLVGTVASTFNDTSLMTLVNGGVLRVRGTGTVGLSYYIRSGEIVDQAPVQGTGLDIDI